MSHSLAAHSHVNLCGAKELGQQPGVRHSSYQIGAGDDLAIHVGFLQIITQRCVLMSCVWCRLAGNQSISGSLPHELGNLRILDVLELSRIPHLNCLGNK